ncbi:MAG: RNA polymerase sigma factor [Bacteroidota bacterium]|nr:RNA polymerase sigma factor [Bacteroidota bacterium]MDP4225153.1 RNA polymerase sigma factor [Bacteroidota bacterium]MDP4273340.1 RNA polymerase sigma factor [Bacteroidota bacterium]
MTPEEYNKSVYDYSDRLYRFILKNIKDKDKANDIIQDTYEKLWLKAETVSNEKVKSYLFTTAYHTMIDTMRYDKRNADLEEIDAEDQVNEQTYTGLQEILHEAVSKLPEVQRSVVLLRDYEGYSYEEIAQITGLSESQVKVYIFRGRIFLKNYIGSLEKVI